MELHLKSNKLKRKMREKRPRISNSKHHPDRPEENVFGRGTNKCIEVEEDKSLVKGKLPDNEIDELRQKDSYAQIDMNGYKIEPNVKESDYDKNWQDNSLSDTAFLKDIYNTIDYDKSM